MMMAALALAYPACGGDEFELSSIPAGDGDGGLGGSPGNGGDGGFASGGTGNGNGDGDGATLLSAER